MYATKDLIDRSERTVQLCGLDTLSIFLRNRSLEQHARNDLTYVLHHGVTEEAQHVYRQNRIFEQDPFASLVKVDGVAGGLVRWEDKGLKPFMHKAKEYTGFLGDHNIDVVGAWVQELLPGLVLVIGAHRHRGRRPTTRSSADLFEYEMTALSQLATAQLLAKVLDSCVDKGKMRQVMLGSVKSENRLTPHLSSREQQIAALVSEGRQNKEIAYLLRLSEYTVENHLRRIFKKLGVHNRAAMAAKLRGLH